MPKEGIAFIPTCRGHFCSLLGGIQTHNHIDLQSASRVAWSSAVIVNSLPPSFPSRHRGGYSRTGKGWPLDLIRDHSHFSCLQQWQIPGSVLFQVYSQNNKSIFMADQVFLSMRGVVCGPWHLLNSVQFQHMYRPHQLVFWSLSTQTWWSCMLFQVSWPIKCSYLSRGGEAFVGHDTYWI